QLEIEGLNHELENLIRVDVFAIAFLVAPARWLRRDRMIRSHSYRAEGHHGETHSDPSREVGPSEGECQWMPRRDGRRYVTHILHDSLTCSFGARLPGSR